jgi:hypothetical protein
VNSKCPSAGSCLAEGLRSRLLHGCSMNLLFDKSKSRALRPAVWASAPCSQWGPAGAGAIDERPPSSAAARGAPLCQEASVTTIAFDEKPRVSNRRARGLACSDASRRRSLRGPESRTTIPVLGDSTSGSRKGISDQSPRPTRAAGWLSSFLSPAPSSGGSRPRPGCFGWADRARLRRGCQEPRPGSDSIKWKNAWESLVKALASRSDNAGIIGPCPDRLPPPASAFG